MSRSITAIGASTTTCPPDGPASMLLRRLRLWHHRHRTRQQLRTLDEFRLADLGLSPGQRDSESEKWFWQS